MERLNNLQPGDKATVSRIDGEHSKVQRLMALALLPGANIEVIRVAPLGDPITVKLECSQLALRKEDASCVVVNKLDS